jgi:hypothetical protein
MIKLNNVIDLNLVALDDTFKSILMHLVTFHDWKFQCLLQTILPFTYLKQEKSTVPSSMHNKPYISRWIDATRETKEETVFGLRM